MLESNDGKELKMIAKWEETEIWIECESRTTWDILFSFIIIWDAMNCVSLGEIQSTIIDFIAK